MLSTGMGNGLFPLLLSLPFFAAACATSAPEPPYIVLVEEKGYEVREYGPYIVAETEVVGEFRESLYGGFRILFDYIDGNNTGRLVVGTEGPVLSEKAEKPEKIPMTAPVLLEEQSEKYLVAFVMPLKSTIDTLPRPGNARIKIREVEKKKVAALRFSWYATEKRVKAKIALLERLLDRDGYRPVSPYRVAYYNPPWTIPFLRRNEILVDIE